MAQRRKLALLGFEQGEGPWITALGSEREVRVTPLKDGESVSLEVEDQIGYQHCFTGTTTIQLSEGCRYRFLKKVPEGVKPSKTTAEVLLDG